MNIKKIFSIAICTSILFSISANAAKPEWAGNGKHNNIKKEKKIPYGLQKKIQRGGQLPPGWKKKIQRGEVLDERVLSNGRIIKSPSYPYIKGTKVYEIEDKIVRVSNATKVILDIFK